MKQKSLVVVNVFNEHACLVSQHVVAFLNEKNIETELVHFSGEEQKDFPLCDFVVTLGGDGTVLFAGRRCAKLGIPIFPINFGEFGFIGGISKDRWQDELAVFLAGKSGVSARSLLQAQVIRNNAQIYSGNCINEAVISAKTAATIICLDVSFNENPFGKFKADGIILSTPTGSTAYSAAAGGPIIDPELEVFVLSPICALSLSNRPIVLSAAGKMVVRVLPSRSAKAVLVLDGQLTFDLEVDDTIILERSPEKIVLAGCSSQVFYSALRSKLQWSGGPLA